MRHRPHQRPPQQHTYTMTRVGWNSTLSCQRRMHRTTWVLLSGMICTLRTLGACTPARAMRQRCRTASAPPLHQRARRWTWRVRQPAPRAKTSGLGSLRRNSCAGLRQPSHGLHGRPRAPARHAHARWAADIRNPSPREHLWRAAVRSAYATASSAVVHPIMSLRSSHLVRDHCLGFGDIAVAAACNL